MATHAHYQVWHKASSQPKTEMDGEERNRLLKYFLHANDDIELFLSTFLARKKQLSDKLARLCIDVTEQTAQFSDQDLL